MNDSLNLSRPFLTPTGLRARCFDKRNIPPINLILKELSTRCKGRYVKLCSIGRSLRWGPGWVRGHLESGQTVFHSVECFLRAPAGFSLHAPGLRSRSKPVCLAAHSETHR